MPSASAFEPRAVAPSAADDPVLGSSAWLSIVGIGEDGVAGLGAVAQDRVRMACLVVGGRRHLALADPLISGERLAWPSPLQDAFPAILARRGQPVTVLASGDPFHYGIGAELARLAGPGGFMAFPQPGAFALAAARLGWLLQDTALVSLHGRAVEGLNRHLQPGARILALSWDGTTPAVVAHLLIERGLGASRLTILEALGGPRERITTTTADALDGRAVDPLNTLAIEVAGAGVAVLPGLTPGLEDDLFDHDGQITKRIVRAVTLSSLAPRRGERLWDIGLGSGSVAIEWLRTDPSLRAIGVEARPERAARARANALKLGVPALDIVVGHAPAALAGLPAPDAVFVGGGFAEPGLFDAVWTALKPGGRLVVNAVTLETEVRLLELRERIGGELVRLDWARAEAVGPRHGWRPAMPLLHWRVTKSGDGA